MLLQKSSRQLLLAAIHFSPLQKHEPIREAHVFFDDVLQLHRSILRGAGSTSAFIGSNVSFI